MSIETNQYTSGYEQQPTRLTMPAYFNTDTGIFALDGSMIYFPEGPKTEFITELATYGRVTSSELGGVSRKSEHPSVRRPKTIVGDINSRVDEILMKGTPGRNGYPQELIVSERTGSNSSVYTITRPIILIPITEIDALGIKTQYGMQTPGSKRDLSGLTVPIGTCDIKIVSQIANIYATKEKIVDVPGVPGVALRYFIQNNTWLSEAELTSVLKNAYPDYIPNFTDLLYRIKNRFPLDISTRLIDKIITNGNTFYKLGESIAIAPSSPDVFTPEQATVLSQLLKHKNGTYIHRDGNFAQFSLPADFLSAITACCNNNSLELSPPQREVLRKQVLQNIMLFLSLSPAVQEHFTKRHPDPLTRDMLDWIIQQNNSGPLAGVVTQFLQDNPVPVVDIKPDAIVEVKHVWRPIWQK